MKTNRIEMNVPAFSDDGCYHMNAILVDCQGNTQLIEVGPDTTLVITEYFAPCPECGVAVLQSRWYRNCDPCARCGITMPESLPTTRAEAEDFLASCINFFGEAFHVDTPGEGYVNRDQQPTFTAEEAVIYDVNMDAATSFFTEDDVYGWCMTYMDTRFTK